MSRGRPLRRLGLRWRITVAFLGGALGVSALLAGTTYVLAERYFVRQRVEAAVGRSFDNVTYAVQVLSPPIGTVGPQPPPEPDLRDLGRLLEDRGDFDVLITEDGIEVFRSFAITRESIPSSLREQVAGDEVAYVLRRQPASLWFGSPVPGEDVAVFFFFPLDDLDETLTVLRNVLLAVSAAAVALAALIGTRVSRRVVDPVRRASRAARRVAEGLLETRLPVTGRDELGALADSFNEMASALEERIARERRFVGDVSHELRTPLTTLRTSTDYLLTRAEDLPPELRRATELLAADVHYLQRLVDDLLEISRAEAGKVRMSWERVNLAELTREVVGRRVRAGGQVRILVDADPSSYVTVADKQRLERVVGNLVENALTHGQGRDVTVRISANDGSFLLAVEDRGPGIPVEAVTRIFERFFKADPSRSRDDSQGSGLGLAIARENAHLHGGEIDVASGEGRGTVFTLHLPRRAEEGAAP